MLKPTTSPATNRLPRLRYRCPSCSDLHDGLPDLAYRFPEPVFELGMGEREQRALISSDLIVLDQERFFIRAVLDVPIDGHNHDFGYGVWAEVNQADFNHYAVHYNTQAECPVASFSARLANKVPDMAETRGLSCRLHLSETEGLRPRLEVTAENHPLADEQRNGMALQRAISIVSTMKGYVMVVD